MDFSNQIGASTNLFANPPDISKTVEYLAERFPIVEIEFSRLVQRIFQEDGPEWRKQKKSILRIIKRRSSSVFQAHAPFIGPGTDTSSVDEETRKGAVNFMRYALRQAHDLGAARFTMHPGYIPAASVGEKAGMRKAFEQLSRSLEELVGIADQLGVMICLENIGKHRPTHVVLTEEQHKTLCKKFNIGLTLDLVNYNSWGRGLPRLFQTIERLMPYLKNVHVSDMNEDEHCHRHLPLGEGNFDYDRVLNFLYDNGYDGNVIIEAKVVTIDGERYVERGLAYIEKLKRVCA